MTEAEIRSAIEWIAACLRAIHDTATERGANITDVTERATASALTADEQTRWDEGTAEVERLQALLARHAELARLSTMPEHVEAPQVNRGRSRGQDAFDTSDLSFNASASELRSRAIAGVEAIAHMDDDRRGRAIDMIERHDNRRGDLARHVLATGSETYRSAAAKMLSGRSFALTADEARVLDEARALTLDGTAGYAVPFVLDPTIIGTSNGSASPMRQLATVKTVVSKTWKGVTSAGVSASYDAESAEVSDDSPTLAQPSISAEKAQAFIPFSIEAGEDWVSIETDVAQMIAEAKDDLEATKFVTGAGSGSHEPKGVITAVAADSGSVVSPATAETFAVADVYAVAAALTERSERNASFMAHRTIYQKIRQFDANGGSALWAQLGSGIPPQLLGYPAYNSSAMDSSWSASATADNYILLAGDFSRYVIVDRVGLNIELVSHLFATANNRPNGQRGFYAYWRNGGDVVDTNAFRVLNLATSA